MKLCNKHLDGRYLIKEAEKAGLTVERGKGDHVKVVAPYGRGMMIIPDRQIGKGLAAKVVKWMTLAGVPLSIIVALLLSLGG